MSDNSQEPSSPSPSSKVDLNKLREELKCCVCLNLFEDPRNLPCGHICCAACVQGLINAANGPIVFGIVFGKSALYKSIAHGCCVACPQCREEYKVPEDGQLPTAFLAKNLVSFINQAEGKAHSDEGQNDDKLDASDPIGTKKLRIFAISLVNEDYVDVDENMAGIVPQNVNCKEVNGNFIRISLDQLDTFLNEHVEGTVPYIIFKFVKFTEPMVQMLRRIKSERFELLDENGENRMCIQWKKCDFARISETSFRFLLDELFCPAYFYISDWIGMPTGHNYDTLFNLKAFQDAKYINYADKIEPDSPNFNLHLDSDVLINFLHSPGYRRLDLIDGQLQNVFDSFLDRLIDRFNKDTERRCYELVVLLLNATDETKERLKVGTALILEHPKGNGKLECTLTKATGVDISIHGHGSNNTDNVFKFKAERY